MTETPPVAHLSLDEIKATAESIIDLQLPNGMIEWFPGGHADPWNHIEAAMALSIAGYTQEAEKAYQWLVDTQLSDGSWHNYYLAEGIEDAKIDTNCVAYIAAGVWHHYLVTGDREFAVKMFDVVDAAIEFVLSHQTQRGEVIWARRANGVRWHYALLTGSSSISHSLGCGVLLAEALGQTRKRWAAARRKLVYTIANSPEAFEPKDRWAMDWYYPVLTGAITGDDAAKRMAGGWDEFVMEDQGVRCVSDQPWMTAAETCEAVIALLGVGQRQQASDLFRWAQQLRHSSGSYFTGIVIPDMVHFPDDERSSYTGAAVILAADALDNLTAASTLFTKHPIVPNDLEETDTT